MDRPSWREHSSAARPCYKTRRAELMDRVEELFPVESDSSDDEVEVVDPVTESKSIEAASEYSRVCKQFEVPEGYAERCGIEGARAGLPKAKMVFIRAHILRHSNQAEVRSFFRGMSS